MKVEQSKGPHGGMRDEGEEGVAEGSGDEIAK